MRFLKVSLLGVLLISGCGAVLSPELIAALANDPASMCAKAEASGGGGMFMGLNVTGGYLTSALVFCRSNHPNAKLSVGPDGAISIQHGEEIK